MGAVAGAVGCLGTGIERAVREMVDTLSHRGGAGVEVLSVGPNAGSRGAILGASCSDTKGSAIAFDGALYNGRELREEVERQGQALRTSSDAELVLKAHRVWGRACLPKLEGTFALAAWDPDRCEMLLARDRLGFKPLYWAEHNGSSGEKTVLFASEVKALLRTGLFPRRIDPVGLQTYAWNGFVVSPRTIVRGIRCLQPGKLMAVTAESCTREERRYWFLGDYEGGRGGSAAIGDALRYAVERQLRCDASVGLFLSGGMDSSAVAALACEVAEGPVRTFNVGFVDTELDESPYARAVAQALGTDHSEIRVTQNHFEDGLTSWLSSLDQPTFDGLNTFLVSRAVRDAGVQVALGGTGGDDLFGGNRTFTEIPLIAQWGRRCSGVPEPLLRFAAQLVTRLKTGKGTIPHQTRWGKLSDVLTSKGRLLDLYQLTYALFTPEFIGQLLTSSAGRELRVGIPWSYADEIEAATQRNPEIYAIAMMEIVIFLGERLLRDLDSASQAVGLEVRAPMLDDALIEVWRSTSPDTAFEPIGKKKVLLDTALSRLDRSLFDRPKAGFVLPIDTWCRDQLGSTVEQTLMDREHCQAVGIDPQTSARLWTAFKRADSGLYWSRIWSIFVYLRLCKREGLELEA